MTGHAGLGQSGAYPTNGRDATPSKCQGEELPPAPAVFASVTGVVAVAFLAAWLAAGGYASLTKRRVLVFAFVIALVALVAPLYFKRQWLRYRRDQALSEVSSFVSVSQSLDSASSAALSLVQEVELVSRGYRMYVNHT